MYYSVGKSVIGSFGCNNYILKSQEKFRSRRPCRRRLDARAPRGTQGGGRRDRASCASRRTARRGVRTAGQSITAERSTFDCIASLTPTTASRTRPTTWTESASDPFEPGFVGPSLRVFLSGRILRATRPIKALEIVLVDPGTVVGPNYSSRPVCLECLMPVTGDFTCSGCSFPMCSPKCEDGARHKKECAILGAEIILEK